METSPRMISPYAVFHQLPGERRCEFGNNIVGDAANECAISVDPTNGNKMTIAWRQFNDVTSNFRQGGWGYTTDAGITWTFPGVLQNNIFRSDPVTNSDETGQFFYLSLQSTWPTQTFYCDDLGARPTGVKTWTEQSPDRSAGGDKAWFTIDKTGGPGHGFQYQMSDGANCFGSGVGFQRSTNGGTTWQSPVNIPKCARDTGLSMWIPTATFSLVVATGGAGFRCVRSSNAQIAGQTPSFDRNTAVNLGGGLLYPGAVNPEGLAGQVFLAVDRSGGATNNNIYILCQCAAAGRSHHRRDVCAQHRWRTRPLARHAGSMTMP